MNEEQTSNLPTYIKELPTGNMIVTTKDGEFELQEREWDKIERATKRAKDRANLAIIAESLVKPQMGELDLAKLKASSVVRLSKAVNIMYDLDSFLSDQNNG